MSEVEKDLRERLAQAEAKCKRLKGEVTKFKCTCPSIVPTSCLRCRILAFLSEPPSTSLANYICEQTDEVVALLERIAKEEVYHEYNRNHAQKALAKLKQIRNEV